MGNGVSRIAKVLACVLLVGCASEAPAQRGEPSQTRYSNPEYAYAVQLPPGIGIMTSTPPIPDQGFGVRLAPPVNLWLYADYETGTISSLAEKAEDVRESFQGSGCRTVERTMTTLGGAPAAELTFQCPPHSNGEPPETVKQRLTLRTLPGRAPIVYRVGLQYPQGSQAGAEAERLYQALIDGFSFTAPEAGRPPSRRGGRANFPS